MKVQSVLVDSLELRKGVLKLLYVHVRVAVDVFDRRIVV